MTEVIDMYFRVCRSFWSLIISNWILSMSLLVSLFGFAVSLYKSTRGDR